MTKIISSPNCGNSPKMAFLKQFNIAFAEGNVAFLVKNVTDNIVWNIIGDKNIEGIEAFAEELEKMKSVKVSELILNQILSHGKEGAANGEITMENGNQYAFSDFYIFQSAKGVKVRAITSYCLKI
ncbi:nuclear transport factor 2 family protein [Formosa sediminum]|uniref:Nuclear transport factor 2 family protein n=1 Tax=Formosa sediminum TaxID=2594004 RepID=A0A516GVI4_9FLAO|nr:nuclear transport factor 2 family protein [Formosa sediminum]QDO95529.1 nuclear transport factor 2 family protein [Formosa sediminum]